MAGPSSPRSPGRASRARGALLGAGAGGRSLLELTSILGDELLQPGLDLGRLVQRWTRVSASAHDLPVDLAMALRWLDEHGAPPTPESGGGAAGLPAHVVPVALLTAEQPANLLSGTWHIAAITHPSPEASWAAVALNVAIARLLQGHRDFVGDVTEALRSNDAPAALLERVRRLPVTRRDELTPSDGSASSALETAFWLSWHEPLVARGLVWLMGQNASSTTMSAATSLYGAHRGDIALETFVSISDAERRRLEDLADRLARVRPPQ